MKAPKQDRRAKMIPIDNAGLTKTMQEQRRIAKDMVKEVRKMRRLASEMRDALRKSA